MPSPLGFLAGMKLAFARFLPVALGLLPTASAAPPLDHGNERRAYTDPVTGVTVMELTAPDRPADNLYFHFSNFTADNRYLLLVATAAEARHLFRVEVESGRLVQLTDDPATAPPAPAQTRPAPGLRPRGRFGCATAGFSQRTPARTPACAVRRTFTRRPG